MTKKRQECRPDPLCHMAHFHSRRGWQFRRGDPPGTQGKGSSRHHDDGASIMGR